MYLIMVYDVGEERLIKVLGIGRRYLTWVQNSVFEGEISEANFIKLKNNLTKAIDKNHDSVTFYMLRTTAYMRKETLGIVKGESTTIL
ncbi:MAG: CRISPR-associated endonuclease Cas2 [Candidatus Odinarchaeota archaeon]